MPAALGPIDADHLKARDFARVFCSTLGHLKDADGRAWGDCARYIQTPEAPQAQRPIPTAYRWLFVDGFGAECFRDVRAFSGAIAHLKDAHQIDVERFPVPPFGSSQDNGRSIARHIDTAWTADPQRKFVLVGYSKGAADLIEALRDLEAPTTEVAALVSIAGVVGGTWVPDDFRTLMDPSQPWMSPSCPGNVQDGVYSLGREVREAFMRQNPLTVPAYSLVATSTLEETSNALRPSWQRLSRYAAEQDGLMVAWEAILPRAKYLGAVRADHWAIALPFDAAPTRNKRINRNRFPRAALLEAVLRYVTTDLAAAEPQK